MVYGLLMMLTARVLVVSPSVCQFAAVQFATTFRTVFDFNDYKDGSAEDKLMKEPHMQKLTNTHGAIDYVL